MKHVRLPTIFISHGGGPWPYIPEMKAQFAKTANWLSGLPSTFPEKPKAILSISGHWETEEFMVSSAEHPSMVYDYVGFPEQTYRVKYEAPGSPAVAKRVQELLTQAGIKNDSDSKRGFDHGTFVPLVLMYPDADIPVVSMSIKANYSPLDHIKLGEALRPLRDEGILIIGSGLSYHNMRGFGSSSADGVSKLFGRWLGETVAIPNEAERAQALLNWEKAPAARHAHPQEDHLLPLMAVAGAAGSDQGRTVLVDHVFGVDMASYEFG